MGRSLFVVGASPARERPAVGVLLLEAWEVGEVVLVQRRLAAVAATEPSRRMGPSWCMYVSFFFFPSPSNEQLKQQTDAVLVVAGFLRTTHVAFNKARRTKEGGQWLSFLSSEDHGELNNNAIMARRMEERRGEARGV